MKCKSIFTVDPLRQLHKIVKHTQTIRLLLKNCFSAFDHFVGLALKGLKVHYADLKILLYAWLHMKTIP